MTEKDRERAGKAETERGSGSKRPKCHHGDKDKEEIRGRASNVTLVVYYLSR